MHNFEDFGIKFERRNLKNGAWLFLFVKKNAPLYIRASINAGTRWNKIPGTAHFTEHMIVAGSKKFPSKDLLALQIEKVGGSFSAYTNMDRLWVNIQAPTKEDLPAVADILNEMLCNSLFNLQTIEKERGAIMSELGSRKSNPRSRAQDIFWTLAFQDTYMKYPNLGAEESIRQISSKDISEFYNKYFSNSRMTYIACGDIGINELKNELENSVNFSSRINNSFPEIPQVKRDACVVAEYFDSKETHLTFGFRVDTQSPEEMAALSVIRNLLVGGRASIFTTKLRYENGLVYGVDGFVYFPFGTGLFSISTSCSYDNSQKVINIICEELNKIFTNGINEETFNFIKNKIMKSKFIEMQTSDSWIIYNEQYLNTPAGAESNIIDFMNIIEKMTIEELNTVFKKYIKPESYYLAICGMNKADSLIVRY